MNASIDMYSPVEVAKSVGVTSTTICNWCRNGLINCNKVGDGNDRDRYEISEDEYRHLRDLARKYGPKKVLLYYKKDWKGTSLGIPVVEKVDISPDGMYRTGIVAKFIGIDKSSVNRYCRNNRIHHETRLCSGPGGAKGYNEYMIPGWELLYLKSLYDKYGKTSGKGSAMVHYIYDVDKRENENMDWSLDMDQVEDDNKFDIPVVKAVENEDTGVIDFVRESTEPKIVESSTPVKELSGFAKVWNDIREVSKVEPSDDKLLDDFIKIRELKRDIDNEEAKLNQMKAEYEQLKGELIEWL